MVERIEAGTLETLGEIAHGFFGRRGGVSDEPYDSLNVGAGSDDDAAAVAENRARIMRALGVARLATAYQEHGTAVIHVDADFDERDRVRGDVLVTQAPGIALGILTADCAPVLLAEQEARIIAAAHAGWRGAAAGVVEAAVAAMERLGAARGRICAAVGPAIGADSYQVGEEVRAAFAGRPAGFERFFRTDDASGKYRFDLAGAVAADLRQAGVGSVEPLGLDTYGDTERFFSYRRATHRGEADYGRQLSAIALL